jgi:hypothetical protein
VLIFDFLKNKRLTTLFLLLTRRMVFQNNLYHMKNIQHIGTNSPHRYRPGRPAHAKKAPKPEPPTGSLSGMYPVVLDGGRTVIYISDKSKENEIRMKYSKVS